MNFNVLDYIIMPAQPDPGNEQGGDILIPYDVVKKTPWRYLATGIEKTIRDGDMRFPFTKYSGVDPRVFLKGRELTHTRIAEHDYMTMIPADFPHSRYLFDGKQVACEWDKSEFRLVNQITDFFTEEARVQARVKGFRPLFEVWRNYGEKVANEAIASARKKQEAIDVLSISNALFKVGVRMPTLFKVTLAFTFYDYFNAEVVFDLSGGWGDRALGAIMSPGVRKYYCCDPNPALQPGYKKIKQLALENGKDVDYEIVPVERFDLDRRERPDLIFTSPPFFDYEIYTEHPDQSIKNFNTVEVWLNNWLIPQTHRVLKYLKPGGNLIYHIATPGTDYDFIGPLIESLKIPGVTFRGGIPTMLMVGYRRPIFLYVWRKDAEF